LCGLFFCFEVVFGLKINLSKSKLVLVGNVNNADGLTSILGFRVSSLTLKHLCLLLGAFFKAISIWDDIIEKIEHCLAGWKLYLPKGRKITLIKSTLSNFSYLFHVSFFPLLVLLIA